MEYIIGQRWVSHADAQLGLGIVVDHENRRVTLSFPAVGEERTYATDNAPLTRLRFKAGDHIRTIDDVELLVTDVQEQQGLLIYTGTDHHDETQTFSELELDSFVQLTTPQQRLLNGHFDRNAEFALRVATFEYLDRLQQSRVRGLLGSRTSLLPHQVYIAAEVGNRHAPRVLLADEVGLGKTIEAGMIVQQQLLSGRASRVLVLVPDSLLHQWLVEMLRRFNLHFALFDVERIANVEGNPFESEQLVLSSLELFEDNDMLQAMALEADWDLAVIDEAHHLHWSPEAAGSDYRFVEALAQRAAGLLLLTATPEQVGQASHFARLRLLDPSRFHDLDAFAAEEENFRALSAQLDAIEAGNLAAAELPSDIDSTATPAAIVEQLLDRHGTGRVLFRNTRAAVKGFPKRILHKHPLHTPEQYALAQVDLDEQLHPESPYFDDSWLDFDPRVDWLEKTLKQLRPEKVLVICASASTATALEHHLHMRAGIRSAAFYEGLTILERDRAAAYFADEHGGAQTLVCSEIGSEGRNFQFAHHLVLFDLPLNPDLLEQRIGRLDRIGQRSDVQLHVPYLEGTAQERLLTWYERGLGIFDECCSAGYAILEAFRDRLFKQLESPDDDWEALLTDTAAFTARTREELREGRDRLLERNSCKADIAQDLIEAIGDFEQGPALGDFMEQMFEVYGVDQEFHSDDALILRPGEHMLTGHFPHLREEGTTVTFARDKALSREDMEFLSWEHPMVVEAMDMVASTELGNATLGTIKLKGIPPGTMLLESLYTINCVAPKSLQVERFLPLSPLRLLVDASGKELAAIVPHKRLNELVEKVKKPTALAIIKRVQREVETKMRIATAMAEERLQALLAEAEATMREELGSELTRLQALRQVNSSIRDEEIDFLRYRIEECAAHITHANLQMQALRLIITT